MANLSGKYLTKITVKDIFNFLKIDTKDISKEELFKKIDNISVNSKCVGENTLFVPLKGEKTDGHKYIDEAFENGAIMSLAQKGCLINSENRVFKDKLVLEVENTFDALRNIGKSVRAKFNSPVIGITGSSGKTTTKEYIYCVLSSKFNVLKNIGNANGQIGVPITLFGLNNSFDIAVLEMGISKFNEMDVLSNLVNPDIAVITNIGRSHLEFLKSLDNIFKEKLKISRNFNKDSLLIFNSDDIYLEKIKSLKLPFKISTFSIENLDANLRAYNIRTVNNETKFNVIFNNIEYKDIVIPTIGKHNVLNSLAAILLGLHFNIDVRLIRRSLLEYVPISGRQCIKKITVLDINNNPVNVTVIDDCYNANLESMKAALETLNIIGKDKRKIAVLADMLEQGTYSREFHEKLGEYVNSAGVDILLCAGDFSKYTYNFAVKINKNLKAYSFIKANGQVCAELKKIVKDGDVLLFKGSLGMNLRSVFKDFTKV